jgi:hypothetical protein
MREDDCQTPRMWQNSHCGYFVLPRDTTYAITGLSKGSYCDFY